MTDIAERQAKYEKDFVYIEAFLKDTEALLHQLEACLPNDNIGEDNVKDATLVLCALASGSWVDLVDFSAGAHSKRTVPALLARYLLECHATLSWILSKDSLKEARATRYMTQYKDLHGYLAEMYQGKTKRTRRKLDSLDSMIKALNNGAFVSYYDYLSYLTHPTGGDVVHYLRGDTLGMRNYILCMSTFVILEMLINAGPIHNLPKSLIDKAAELHRKLRKQPASFEKNKRVAQPVVEA